jgi:23S rRNA (adenine2503-C2)-methyltransferase
VEHLAQLGALTAQSAPIFGIEEQALREYPAFVTLPSFRIKQILHAIYRNRVETLDEITTLPRSLREQLRTNGVTVGIPQIAETFRSVDGTERYLVRCADGEVVETVWMPEGDDGEQGDGSEAADEEGSKTRRRATICISSQVGCAVNCQFCLTAKLGVKRNLTAGEIAGQVAAVLNRHQVDMTKSRINLVFMGMGEPFLNYDNFIASVRLLSQEMGIAESRMTVSTSGILPGITRLAQETIRPKLALSLNASNNKVREAIMPITRKWDIAALMDALRDFPLRNRERLTFEYVLLGGVNDAPEHARELAAIVLRSGLPAKINLIAWNPGPDVPYSTPDPREVARFQQTLIAAGVPAFLRKPRGRDIFAACGQLKRTVSVDAIAVAPR